MAFYHNTKKKLAVLTASVSNKIPFVGKGRKRSPKIENPELVKIAESNDQKVWQQKFADLNIESPLRDSLRFKSQLQIGEKAFALLRIKTMSEDVWDSTGVGLVGAKVASTLGATGFFGTSGILGLLGIGSAATPLVVIIAAGVVSGVGWNLFRGYLRSLNDDRIISIPKYLNTPLDILAVGIFDLLATLSLKVAKTDGMINNLEFEKIVEHFVRQWGFDPKFVEAGIAYFYLELDNYDTARTAQEFAAYLRENPDCNFKAITRGTTDFLEDLASVEDFGHESKTDEILIIKDSFSLENSYFEKFMAQITPTRDFREYLKILKKVK
ncbi:MAG: hypothetical protein OXC82_04430 [Rhodobacteraceae bacterium]|nr:hypothetical protein [Paracoccaceae bacterium]MCY4249667.1 hypothetical protein [Paracoccaceae bacterium]MCY4309605.1 hypothetical protein [Paracoccaceae bacterium]